MKLGEALAAARYAKGMSLRDLSIATGIHNGVLSRMETGAQANPIFRNVVAISKVLDVPLEQLAATDLGTKNAKRSAQLSRLAKRTWKDPDTRATLVAKISKSKIRNDRRRQNAAAGRKVFRVGADAR